MGIRPRPTKDFIIAVCGEKMWLTERLHHGLVETSLRNYYPVLDFDESVAFAVSSWRSRQENLNEFNHILSRARNMYDVFSQVLEIGIPTIRKYGKLNKKRSEVSEKFSEMHMKMNPYRGGDLKDRIEAVDEYFARVLLHDLRKPVREYDFEAHYLNKKRSGCYDTSEVEIMRFQKPHPRKGKVMPAFAAEVMRIFRKYPLNYVSPGEKPRQVERGDEQLTFDFG